MRKSIAIGADIGGSHILSAAIDIETGAVLENSRVHVRIDNKASAEKIFQDWADCLNGTLERINTEEVNGIGFAMPGAFNYKEGIAMFDDNDKYENLYGMNVADHLRPLIKIHQNIPLRFHNDASCFAMGVDWYGVAKTYNRSISITLGTGFGSAFIDQGIPIVSREDVPGDGCLWHLPFNDGMADDYFSTRWFIQEYQTRFGEALAGVKEIADQVKSKPEVKAIFNLFGTNLADFLAPWIKKFSPEVIVLGGNVAGAFDFFSPSLYQELDSRGVPTDFKISRLKEDAAIIGSARLLDESFYQQLKDQLPTK